MTDRLTLQLNDAQSGHKAMAFAWTKAKPLLLAGHRLQLQIKPETRSLAQNRLLHSILRDLSEQLDWPQGTGMKHDIGTWKRLCTGAMLRAQGKSVQMVPALDGQGFEVIYRKTSHMSKAMLSDLCEYAWAYGSERGVEWSPTSLGEDA